MIGVILMAVGILVVIVFFVFGVIGFGGLGLIGYTIMLLSGNLQEP